MAALPVHHRRRSPRQEGGRTAFVLSGGGNQGVAQVGMLLALAERGIIPDVVVGTSAGALNGCGVALSPTVEGVERLGDVWRSLRTEDVFLQGRFARAWNVLRRSDHLFSNEGLARIVERVAPGASFADLAVPLRVVTTDLETGEEVVLASGPLRPALLASTALPGIFPPVHHDDRVLIDGGVVNNVPLRHALAGPVERVYVLNVATALRDRPIRYPLDVVLQAFAIARNRRYELERTAAPAGVEVIELPRPPDGRSIFDFSGNDILIEEAYAMASRFLDEEHLRHTGRRRERRRWLRRSHPLESEVA